MSWLARSLANSLKFDDNDDDSDAEADNGRLPIQREEENGEEKSLIESPDDATGRGVKEDLSELTKTLTRQLWGVASFLAPPPSERSEPLVSATNRMLSSPDCSVTDWNRWESSAQSVSGRLPDPEMHDSAGIEGIRSDLAEIGGKFKTGFSKLSNNKAVSEISKIASTFLPFGSDEDSEEKYTVENAVGVTDEVMAFARNIAMHPETWLDFPLADDEDSDDFDMSDAQQEHALAVECLAPRLAALRIELCPNYMSEGLFWKIYFVLLHSRLNKHDAELLSTPQIVEARAMLMQDLQKRTCPEPDWSGRGLSHSRELFNSLHKERFFSQPSFATGTMPLTMSALELPADLETDKHPVVCSETQFIDKTVVKEEPAIKKELKENSSAKHLDQRYEEDDEDDWLEDQSSEIAGFARTTIPLGNEEDVSFSDLEDVDDDGDMGSSSKIEIQNSVSTAVKDSHNWAQFKDGHSNATENNAVELSHGTENKELNDWLSLDNVDA